MIDQAQALRHLVHSQDLRSSRLTRVITVTSGKGGVGKSNFCLNFAMALQNRGYSVLVFDADVSFANIDVLMGTPAKYNLIHLLKGEKSIWEIIQVGPAGLQFVAGGSGFQDLVRLSERELDYFAEQIGKLHGHVDYILFDTGAGLSKETTKFIAAAEEAVVVTTPEPTSITDAYALIKMIHSMGHGVAFRLVVNRVMDDKEGHQTADNIRQVASKYLGIDVPALGFIPDDASVPKAVKRQTPLSIAYPNSDAAQGIDRIAARYLMEERPSSSRGLTSFMKRIRKLWR
ncbi:MinD/ParA family protein [Paenibacillaceae bacterium WGS1546]|uniref:MinD/ParA family protein n=1 Tax=Cohnella sp. WGS1546 TaxID=3366810 RepID=UPI00372D461E